MTTLLLLLFSAFCVFMIFRTSKRQTDVLDKDNSTNTHLNKTEKLSAYQLYFNWCKKSNETPVSEEKFNQLVDEKGGVNFSDMIALHPNFGSKSTTETEISEEEKRKKRDQEFINSAIIGYMSDSTSKGTLFGGNLFGGMLGKHLSKKKKK